MKKFIYILPVLFLALQSFVYPQSRLKFDFYGGYSIPLAELKGEFPDTLGTSLLDFNRSTTLLTKSGYNFGVTGKYLIDTSGKGNFTAGFSYGSFSGSKNYTTVFQKVDYKNKVNIFSIFAGLQYNFNPKKKINPFVGLEFSANFFGGDIEATGDTLILIDRKSENRYGAIAGAGLDVNLNEKFGLVVGVKYAFTNLIGKKTESVTTGTGNLDTEGNTGGLVTELPLNDEQTSSNKSKTLNYAQFFVGLSVDFSKLFK